MASQPPAATPKGGVEFGFAGESGTSSKPQGKARGAPDATDDLPMQGPLLEQDDHTVFETVHNLVLRQRLLFDNHVAQDKYWTLVKLGYPFATLEKVQDQSRYLCTLPQGVSKFGIQAVPNESWNLVNKACENLLADPAAPDPQPLNDSEEAERASDMTYEFLSQNSTSAAMHDASIRREALERSLVTASTYQHYWTDPTGGGYVPLQVNAHPEAENPQNPLIGPDGQPTSDPILRYVTEDGQFTDDPSQAGQQWVPKINADQWGREHICCFPETADVAHAETIVGKWYCTLGEGKRRWKNVAALSPSDLSTLCDWTPSPFLPLLPEALRARWKINTGSDRERAGSSDERVMFFYVAMVRPRPGDHEHPLGAEVYVTGAFGGFVLQKDTLALKAKVPSQTGDGDKTEIRCMELPVNQMRPRQDPDQKDPSGRAFIEMFGGACEFNATLGVAYLEAIDQNLHVEKYTMATSPVEGFQVEDSRSTGDGIPVLSKDDIPFYPSLRPLPNNFLEVWGWSNERSENIASLTKPVQSSDKQAEVSGKARSIAVAQAQVGLSSMKEAVNAWDERHWRLVLQQAQKHMAAPILIRYTGEDGSYQVDWFNAQDFALVGNVRIREGSGTLQTPDQKVQYANSLLQANVLGRDEALAIIRPNANRALGRDLNPHEQRVEREVSTWLKGMPKSPPGQPTWADQQAAYLAAVQANQQYQQEQQAAQAQAAAQQQAQQQQQAQAQQMAQAKAQQSELDGKERQKAQDDHTRALELERVKNDGARRLQAEKPVPAMAGA